MYKYNAYIYVFDSIASECINYFNDTKIVFWLHIESVVRGYSNVYVGCTFGDY
jgi:hypothetical protein